MVSLPSPQTDTCSSVRLLVSYVYFREIWEIGRLWINEKLVKFWVVRVAVGAMTRVRAIAPAARW